MTKFKYFIISIIFALAIASAVSSNNLSNYNADEDFLKYLEEESESNKFNCEIDPDHGARFQYYDGIYYGMQIYSNVTHRNECLAFLPDAHDDIVDICNALKNITKDTDYVDLLRYILNKTDHILERVQETGDDCKIYSAQVNEVNAQVRQYLHKLGWMSIFKHWRANKDVVKEKIQTYKADLKEKNWYQAGYDMGDLINFILLWDYQAPQFEADLNSHLGHLNTK